MSKINVLPYFSENQVTPSAVHEIIERCFVKTDFQVLQILLTKIREKAHDGTLTFFSSMGLSTSKMTKIGLWAVFGVIRIV